MVRAPSIGRLGFNNRTAGESYWTVLSRLDSYSGCKAVLGSNPTAGKKLHTRWLLLDHHETCGIKFYAWTWIVHNYPHYPHTKEKFKGAGWKEFMDDDLRRREHTLRVRFSVWWHALSLTCATCIDSRPQTCFSQANQQR